jgi:hypothetical protein
VAPKSPTKIFPSDEDQRDWRQDHGSLGRLGMLNELG